MTVSNWASLLAKGVIRGRKRFMLCGVGIMAGIASLTYFLMLGKGVKEAVLGSLIRDLPAEEAIVTSPAMSLGPIQMDRPKLLGGPKILDDDVVAKLSGLKVNINGKEVAAVSKVWRQLDASFPASISGELLGVPYGTDTAISGVDPEMVEGDIRVGSFSYKADATEVPCLVPEALLEVYNSAFARSQNLPQLNQTFLFGKHFNMHLGHSSVTSVGGVGRIETKGVIVGLTGRGTLLGITVPIGFVKDWNSRISKSGTEVGYRMLTVVAKDASYIPAISEAVRGMGFEVRSSTGLAERVGGIIAMVTAGLSLLAAVILFVAGLNAWSLFRLMAMERRKEMGLLMALGATKREVHTLVLGEAALVGIAGGLAGLLVSLAAGWITNVMVRHFVYIAFLPDRIALFYWGAAATGMALAMALALLAALPAANELKRLDPAEILS